MLVVCQGFPLILLSAPLRARATRILSAQTHSYVQVQRRKQIFTFLLEGATTIAAVKKRIAVVAEQHSVEQAAEDCRLLVAATGVTTDDEASLASLVKEAGEGLSFNLVYSIGDDEYEPIDMVATQPEA